MKPSLFKVKAVSIGLTAFGCLVTDNQNCQKSHERSPINITLSAMR